MQNVSRLLIWCPDRRGIIAAVTSFLAERGANILDADQHTDADDHSFFMRLEFEGEVDLQTVGWPELAASYGMEWRLEKASRQKRMAVLVSRQDHCLQDLLWRTSIGEWHAQIACVVSNHPDCGALVATHGVRYHLLPITPETKAQQELRLLQILDQAQVDVVVLARYMQVLTEAVIRPWANRIINIHHSFLPAFSGGRPYHQAHERGVKLIGATAHYVTAQLDAGPILAQATTAVNHRDRVEDLVRKGRDLERTTLAAAVRAHLADRVLVHAGRTVVFD